LFRLGFVVLNNSVVLQVKHNDVMYGIAMQNCSSYMGSGVRAAR